MTSSSFRRKIVVLLLAAILAAPWAWAAETRSFSGLERAGTPLDLFSRLWNALTALWGENGCSVDPNGSGDEGCSVDPSGGTLSPGDSGNAGATSDAGCSVDPSGGCRDGE